MQRISEGLRERGEQYLSLGVAAGQEDGAMQGNDGFAGACGAGDTGGAAVVAFNQVLLGRVQKNRPLFPGVVQGALEFFLVGHDSESALSVGMVEGVAAGGKF